MKNIKKNINILLTDTLPYEIPIFFSNTKLIDYIDSLTKEEYLKYMDKGYFNCNFPYLPLNFYSHKNSVKKRLLSIPHFISQLNYLFFLEKYNQHLLNFFSLNNLFSIRIPKKITKNTYQLPNLKENIKELLTKESNCNDNDIYKTFFYNGNYENLSQFYNSPYAKKLEKQFPLLLQLDIKKCFYNIYSHSIDWAYLGDKKIAKKNISNKNRISAILDKILQNSNNGETHGIIVGPEFSRISAEIVLSKIDTLLYLKLKNNNLLQERDYNIVRYIDDFYIFANNETTLNTISTSLEEILEEYKLSINDSKKTIEQRPFFKDQFWSYKLSKAISIFYNDYKTELIGKNKEANKYFIKKNIIETKFNKLLLELKDLITLYSKSDYKIISYFLSSFSNNNLLKSPSEDKIKDPLYVIEYNNLKTFTIIKKIELLIDIVNYSLTATNIFKLFEIFKDIIDDETYDKVSKHQINHHIFIKIEELIRYNLNKKYEITLLISYLKYFDFNLNQNLLIEILKNDPNYLTIITILFYLNTKNRKKNIYKNLFLTINTTLNEKINEIKFENKEEIFKNSQYIFLLHDISFCEVFNSVKEIQESFTKIKTTLYELYTTNKDNQDKANKIQKYKKFYTSKLTFINWNLTEKEFRKYIIRKKYREYE